MSKKRSHPIKLYRSYQFRGQDPVVRDVLSFVNDDQTTHEKSDVSRSTIRNWRTRKTRRPQFATLEAVLRSNGARFTITTED